MSEPSNTVNEDTALAVTLTVSQLREIVRQEIARAGCSHSTGDDRLLNVEEASKLLGMSEDWLYRNAKRLAFTHRVGSKTLKFSSKGIQKWIDTRKLN